MGKRSVNAAHDLGFMLTSKNISICDGDTVAKAWQVLRLHMLPPLTSPRLLGPRRVFISVERRLLDY